MELQDMKIPEPILEYLRSKRIVSPTPIQLQGIPVAYVPCEQAPDPITNYLAFQDGISLA